MTGFPCIYIYDIIIYVGLLETLTKVITSSHNTSHDIITWEEPFTLDITDVDPDIIGYTVCSSVGENHECINTTVTEFILSKFHFPVNVTITSWNIVGESPPTQHYISPCTNLTELQGIYNNNIVIFLTL